MEASDRLGSQLPWSDDFPEAEVLSALDRANLRKDEALSLYLHIPFCPRRCAYCGCNVVVSPQYDPVEAYLAAVARELDLAVSRMPDRRKVLQLHWGGGTPTYLNVADLKRTFNLFKERFEFLPQAEILAAIAAILTGWRFKFVLVPRVFRGFDHEAMLNEIGRDLDRRRSVSVARGVRARGRGVDPAPP